MIAPQPPSLPRIGLCALVLLALAVLAACQSTRAPDAAPPQSWRVVERSGDARVRLAGAADWSPVVNGAELAGASRVVTGPGGRLIVVRGGDMAVLGPAADVELPAGLGERALYQSAGRMRYRTARDAGPPLRVRAPHLVAEASLAVFDLAAEAGHSRVHVIEGRLRVESLDAAHVVALAPGEELTVSPGRPWQVRRDGVEEALAVGPQSAPAGLNQAPPAAAAVVPAGFPPLAEAASDADAQPARIELEPMPATRAGADEAAALATTATLPPPAAQGDAAEAPPVEPRWAGFNRLTAGLLDGLRPQRIGPATPRRP